MAHASVGPFAGDWYAASTRPDSIPPVTMEDLKRVQALAPPEPEYDCMVLTHMQWDAMRIKTVREAVLSAYATDPFHGLEVYLVRDEHERAIRVLELTAEGRRPLTV